MNTREISQSLDTLLRELVHGAPGEGAFVLNRGDPGLLKALDGLSARAASAAPSGSATVAAHVEHIHYGIQLMNRWAAGENPFADADWAAAWKTTGVSDDEWTTLRRKLRDEVERWLRTLAEPREVAPVELNGMIGSIVHLAYHLGALRQMNRTLRGPPETAGS